MQRYNIFSKIKNEAGINFWHNFGGIKWYDSMIDNLHFRLGFYSRIIMFWYLNHSFLKTIICQQFANFLFQLLATLQSGKSSFVNLFSCDLKSVLTYFCINFMKSASFPKFTIMLCCWLSLCFWMFDMITKKPRNRNFGSCTEMLILNGSDVYLCALHSVSDQLINEYFVL